MVSEPFAPLPGRGRTRRPAAATKGDAWRVICPVPDDAPPPPPQHYRHGKAARTETYRDPDGRVIGYVWRIDLADGGKEFAPLTLCENGAGRRSNRRRR